MKEMVRILMTLGLLTAFLFPSYSWGKDHETEGSSEAQNSGGGKRSVIPIESVSCKDNSLCIFSYVNMENVTIQLSDTEEGTVYIENVNLIKGDNIFPLALLRKGVTYQVEIKGEDWSYDICVDN